MQEAMLVVEVRGSQRQYRVRHQKSIHHPVIRERDANTSR